MSVFHRPFRRASAGVKVGLDEAERTLLRRLLDDVDGLLADDEADRTAPLEDLPTDDPLAALELQLAAPPPSDPAVARLLPDGNREDPELAAGYRRLTEDGLRARKRAGLSRASAALARPGTVVLDADEAMSLLKGLTDVRLVLAERLGLRTDEDAERLHAELEAAGTDDARAAYAAVYEALTYWQESLVSALR